MGRFKLNEGDIFAIPLKDNNYGFGQVIAFPRDSDAFIALIYDFKEEKLEKVDLKTICKKSRLFLGYTFDAKLYHKDWIILGNFKDNLDTVPLPYHKLGLQEEEPRMVDYKGDFVVKIDENAFHKLDYRTEIAPIRYENALKAHFGYGEWKHGDYDKLLYKETLKSVEIAHRILAKH